MNRARQLGPAGLLAIAVAFGFARYGYGLFVPEFREAFGLSTEVLGFVASGAYASYLVALLVTGALVARVGPRLPVVAGGLSAAVGMLMIALAPNTSVLVAGVLLAATSPGWSWAPFSDAVARMVTPESQGRTLSVITTGTTFGVLVAGPAALFALFAGGAWRWAWVAFAVVAVAVAAWNARLLPAGPHDASADGQEVGSAMPRLEWRWFFGHQSVPLFVVALSFGFGGTVYWTYAVDLISRAGGLPASAGPLFWTAVGAAGIAGVGTGDLISRLGLRLSLAASLLALAVSAGLIGAAPGLWVVLGISAGLFGASFMVMSALLVNWTSNVFPEQPGTGFSATQIFIALGTITGPAVMGILAARLGLGATFLITAALVLVTIAVRPQEGVNSDDGGQKHSQQHSQEQTRAQRKEAVAVRDNDSPGGSGAYGRLRQVCRWLWEVNGEMARGLDLRQEPTIYRVGADHSRRELFTPWAPVIEVFTRDSDLVVRAELPGLRPEEVDLTLSEGVLVISGEREAEGPGEIHHRCYLREPHYGPFRRSLTLPEGFGEDEGQMSAVFEDGILEVTLREAAAASEKVLIEPPIHV